MTTLRVKIWRGAESGHFHEYEVPRQESQTVLDVVTYVQRRLDPSLAYRFACRVGVCGSCAMKSYSIAPSWRAIFGMKPNPGEPAWVSTAKRSTV